VDTTQFFFHYKYLDEGRLFGDGLVGWYVVRIADPQAAPQVAARLDALFANSEAETKTTTEKAFAQAFANQVGNIGLIIRSVLAAVFFTLLLLAANTMAQSVRERTSELAVLKTLGFTGSRILALVIVESCALAAAGGLPGLAIAWWLISQGDPTGGMLPGFFLPVRAVWAGLALVVGFGLVAGIFPALQATRLRIVDALRRV
jgi:putative ABC transport system permease protein